MSVKVIKFGADWCGACEQAEKYLTRVKDTLPVEIESVDVDQDEALAIKYNIRSIPTFIAVKPNGDIVGQFIGFDSKKLLAFLEEVKYF